MATITKKDLVDRIAEATGQSRNQVKQVVQQFLDEMVADLVRGDRLEFRDFGVFESRWRKARQAQNPKTLVPVAVPSKRTIKFKVGRLLKQRLNEADEAAQQQVEAASLGEQTTSAEQPQQTFSQPS